jgi:hypothetical protein
VTRDPGATVTFFGDTPLAVIVIVAAMVPVPPPPPPPEGPVPGLSSPPQAETKIHRRTVADALVSRCLIRRISSRC